MKAAVLAQPNESLSIEERVPPEPGRGEVVISVRACGVCHSDVNLQRGDFPFARYPVVPGHEVAGVVHSVGDDVDWPRPGDRVGMPWLFWACGHCQQCTSGDEVMCEQVAVTGVSNDGGFQQLMLAPASYVAPIPDALELAQAAPIMCAGLTVHNGLRNAGFEPGNRVAVIGLGGLGHLAIKYTRAMGGRPAVLSSSDEKRAEAERLGAERFINTGIESPAEALGEWQGGADVVLATAPAMGVAADAVSGLAPDGTLVVLGVTTEQIGANPMELITGRRRIMGSPSGSRHDLRAALELSANFDVLPEITTFSLDQANEALSLLHEGRMKGRAVLTPN